MRSAIAALALLAGICSAEAAEYQPNDVRPWAAFLAARKAVREAAPRDLTLAPRMMLDRLGPLPWRFEVEAGTPFTSPAVVSEMFVRAESDGFHRVDYARARFDYPENKGALTSEDMPIFGLIHNGSPRDDGSKFQWSAPYGRDYR